MSTTLSYIFSGLQNALTTQVFFKPNTCFFAFDAIETLAYPPNDQYCVITPSNMDVKQRVWQGGGARAYLWSWSFDITLFTRLATDESNRDDYFLLDPFLGNLALTDQIIDILQNYNLTQNNETFGFELDRISWMHQKRESTGWGLVTSSWHTDLSSRSS